MNKLHTVIVLDLKGGLMIEVCVACRGDVWDISLVKNLLLYPVLGSRWSEVEEEKVRGGKEGRKEGRKGEREGTSVI
jgi:hypothetical protein